VVVKESVLDVNLYNLAIDKEKGGDRNHPDPWQLHTCVRHTCVCVRSEFTRLFAEPTWSVVRYYPDADQSAWDMATLYTLHFWSQSLCVTNSWQLARHIHMAPPRWMVYWCRQSNLTTQIRKSMVFLPTPGRRFSQYSLDKTLLNATPNPHFKAQVTSHWSYLECTDMIVIIPTIARTLHFTCTWKTQYQLLPTHLRCIIGPCPTPPQIFQYVDSLTHIRFASDGSVIHNQGFKVGLLQNLKMNYYGNTRFWCNRWSTRRCQLL
jgi:hypothetical protein